jgi:hypothetical protein
MKKFFIVFVCLFLSIFTLSCSKSNGLVPFVSELRSNLYEGSSESFKVKAGYGFKESPYSTDGVVKEKTYALTFKIITDLPHDTAFTLNFDYCNAHYSQAFKFNPITHSLTASVEIENFNEKEFNVSVQCGSQTHRVTMRSTIPDGTIDYTTALGFLEKNQPELIKAFSDTDGNFNAEIRIRILVKDGKAYWYVGLGQPDRLKALLLDGKTGDVLAIRDIF